MGASTTGRFLKGSERERGKGMATNREQNIQRLIHEDGVDPSVVGIDRENEVRGRETVWAKFWHDDEYLTFCGVSGVDSPDESIAREITEKATQAGVKARFARPGSPTGCRIEINDTVVTWHDGRAGRATCGQFTYDRTKNRWSANIVITTDQHGPLDARMIVRKDIADDFSDRDLSAFAVDELRARIRQVSPSGGGFEFSLEPAYGLSYPKR